MSDHETLQSLLAENRHYQKMVRRLNDEPADELIKLCQGACRMSLRNTAVGAWLGVVIERLATFVEAGHE